MRAKFCTRSKYAYADFYTSGSLCKYYNNGRGAA